jgi:hypothetical protein
MAPRSKCHGITLIGRMIGAMAARATVSCSARGFWEHSRKRARCRGQRSTPRSALWEGVPRPCGLVVGPWGDLRPPPANEAVRMLPTDRTEGFPCLAVTGLIFRPTSRLLRTDKLRCATSGSDSKGPCSCRHQNAKNCGRRLRYVV